MRKNEGGNKLKKFMFLMMIVIIFGGCNILSETPKEKDIQATVKALTSTDHDYRVVKALGNINASIFEFDLKDDSISEIEFWLEKYENGEFKGNVISGGSPINNIKSKSNDHRIYWSNINVDQINELWTVSFAENENYSAGTTLFQKNISYEGMMSTTDLIRGDKNEIVKGEDFYLGAVIRNEKAILSSNNIDELIQKHTEVFVLKCKLV